MGIKHFYNSWFKTIFAKRILPMRSGDYLPYDIDTLGIDANGFIHGAVKEYITQHQNRIIPRKKPNADMETWVFEHICEKISHFVEYFRPIKKLVLCIDGPAPISKQNQQRQRRFRAASERAVGAFDTNCITPGTSFMEHLSEYIEFFIHKKMTESQSWAMLDIVFSPASVPGEGEHKIVSYIRKNQGERFALYGVDADLIMLGLGAESATSHFYVIRDEAFENHLYNVINISAVKGELINELKWVGVSSQTETDSVQTESTPLFDPALAINDFIAMCFFVGNDFLPHVPSIEIVQGSITIMMTIYKECCARYGHLTNPDLTINKVSFAHFLQRVGAYEEQSLIMKLENRDHLFEMPLLDRCSFRTGTTFSIDLPKYRDLYYSENFTETSVNKICRKYIDGVCWVLKYYISGVPSWNWCYPYHYAPFARDMGRYLAESEKWKQPVFDTNDFPTRPFVQLLSVLPPQSSHLLPAPLDSLLAYSGSPLSEFCPKEFRVDVSGCRSEWEGITIVPMVNLDLVTIECEKRIDSVASEAQKRNILKNSAVFVSRPDKEPRTKRFTYGKVQNCQVVKSIIKF